MSVDPQQPDIDPQRQSADVPGDATSTPSSAGGEVPWREEQLRDARKRAVIWGLGGGLIMSLLLIGACVLLLLAANA